MANRLPTCTPHLYRWSKMCRLALRHGMLPLIALCFWLTPAPAFAGLDLSRAEVTHLDNGLTLIVLEEHSFPVVSVQSLYRVGARNETAGATGLAHFVEHMAFRDSENFPDSGLVSSIYAAGGEWHGYTWLDQTTYFATAPSEQLDLLLRIEADRMARLDISEDKVLAERGAVITELHSYENDPATVLTDQVMYLTFLAHPYRNNTIGWESDVSRIGYADVVDFYQRHYHAANAIIAVVGDVDAGDVRKAVQTGFGALPVNTPTPLPHTLEPRQTGERRLTVRGGVDRKYFKIAWRAPSASNPDYAAFLLAQEMLSGGSGVSFLQNDWGTPARPEAPLAGVTDDLTTWFPPSAQDYVFVVSGSIAGSASEATIESALQQVIQDLRQQLASAGQANEEALEQARQRVRRDLVFDVLTTEDAAHQLAFFAGLGALDTLLNLPAALDQVSAGDVHRILRQYLGPDQRNIAWYVPVATDERVAQTETGPSPTLPSPSHPSAAAEPTTPGPASRSNDPAGGGVAQPPQMLQLASRLPVIVQRSNLSPTISLRVITPLAEFPDDVPATAHQPAWNLSSLDYQLLPDEWGSALAKARDAMAAARPWSDSTAARGLSPEQIVDQYFTEILGLAPSPFADPLAPVAVIVSGDIDPERAAADIGKELGGLGFAPPVSPAAPETAPPTHKAAPPMDIESTLPSPLAQVHLGYVAPAPGPGEPAAAAWRMALYIFSHGYEGRLGKEAIGNRGLIYYIDSAYPTDGHNGWISLSMGVDPDKLPDMKRLLHETLLELETHPPTQQEVDEARNHLLGRFLSAAQSNEEWVSRLGSNWLWYGSLPTYADMQELYGAVQRQDILDLLPAFTHGSIVAVQNPGESAPTP